MKTVNEDGVVLDPESHLKWIKDKQRAIASAQLDYDTKKSVAKEAREVCDTLISELLSFISDLNNGQEALKFDDGKEE
jgi:hypothetical protein